MEEAIYLGTIVNIRGLHGEMKLDDIMPECPVIPEGTEVYVGYSPTFSQKFKIKEWKNGKKLSFVQLQNVETDEAAREFKEKGIFIEQSLLESFIEEPIAMSSTGLKVFDNSTSELIGEVMEVWDLPANKVWYIRTDEGMLPVPVTAEVVAEVDYDTNTARINVVDGLMDLLEPDAE